MRVLCYNIRHGQGVGGLLSNTRIARLISRSGCDVAALSEVWRITGTYDQPHTLARQTGMTGAYHPLSRTLGIELGNLALCGPAVNSWRNIDLGGRRGCLVVDCGIGDEAFVFAATHLSLDKRVRRSQMQLLAEELPHDRPLVLAGDLNCGPGELDPLRELLSFSDSPPRTYPSVAPFRSLDHIGYSRHWRLDVLLAVPSWASDHLPLLAELSRTDD